MNLRPMMKTIMMMMVVVMGQQLDMPRAGLYPGTARNAVIVYNSATLSSSKEQSHHIIDIAIINGV